MKLPLPRSPGRFAYALTAAMLILLQHAFVMLAFHADIRLFADIHFLLFPIHRLLTGPSTSPFVITGGFAFSMLISAALVILSLRRAARLGRGGGLALMTIVPTLQLVAVLALTILWRRRDSIEPEIDGAAIPPHRMAAGVLSGMALIVAAVAVSALTFGAYGFGLFVMTPFLVGVTTGYIVNHGKVRGVGQTFAAVSAAAFLGAGALLMLGLEGFLCLLLASPLVLFFATVGGAIGRAAARRLIDPREPFYSVAILPLIFLIDAAMPPEIPIATHSSVTVAAPPGAVWASLIANRPVTEAPGLVGLAGLAYPVASRILGEGAGARRVGTFSTGIADERITIWKPGRTLAFRVIRQPPAMEEMSPCRKLHTPHLVGYFDTGETRFDLEALPGGRTRLTARADHVLRIDPGLYWEPIARWAIKRNVTRVLTDARKDAERRIETARQDAPGGARSPYGHTITQLAR
ncbi:hypothetical protein [Sphingopyxis panaciterrae]